MFKKIKLLFLMAAACLCCTAGVATLQATAADADGNGTATEFELKEVFKDTFDSELDMTKYTKVDHMNASLNLTVSDGVLKASGGWRGVLVYNTDLDDYAISFKMKSPTACHVAAQFHIQNLEGVLSMEQANRDIELMNAGIQASIDTADAVYVSNYRLPWAPPRIALPESFDRASDWLEVKIIMVGNYLQLFLQNDIVIDTYVNTFTTGPVGLRFYEPSDVQIDDFTFYEVLNKDAVDTAEDVECVEIGVDGFAANSVAYGATTDAFTSADGAYTLAAGKNQSLLYKDKLKDVDISAEFSGTNINAGIIFRATMNDGAADPATGYFAGFVPSTNYISIGRWGQGGWTNLTYVPIFGLSAESHIFRVKTDGPFIQAYLDGELILTVYDDAIAEGYAGIKAFTLGEFSAATIKLHSFGIEKTSLLKSYAQVNAEGTALRFVSTIDALDYKNVGFVISINGTEKNVSISTVYTSIKAGDSVLTASNIHAAAQYVFAYSIWDIPADQKDTEITVKAYWVEADGTVVYGESATFTVNGVQSAS